MKGLFSGYHHTHDPNIIQGKCTLRQGFIKSTKYQLKTLISGYSKMPFTYGNDHIYHNTSYRNKILWCLLKY